MKAGPLVVFAVALAFGAGTPSQAVCQGSQARLNEIQGYLHEVEVSQDRMVRKLESAEDPVAPDWECRVPGAPPVPSEIYSDLGSSEFNDEFLKKGEWAKPFQRLLDELSAWESAIQSGIDTFPPLDQIRPQMAAWRKSASRAETLVDRLARVQAAYGSINKRLRPLVVCIISDSEWNKKYDEELSRHPRGPYHLPNRFSIPSDRPTELMWESMSRLENEFGKTESLLGDEFHQSFPITPPMPNEAPGRSPFDGRITPGRPDRLWIWTARDSGLIGEGIPAQIGLGNNKGPNVVADRDYSFGLKCDGCGVASPQGDTESPFREFNISKGGRYVSTTIVPKETKLSVAATSGDLSEGKKPLGGCKESDDLHIVTNQLDSQALADGKSPVKFQIIFEDPHGDQATNDQDRAVRFNAPNGYSVDPNRDAFKNDDGVLFASGGTCISSFSVTSVVAGQSSMDAIFRDTPAQPKLAFLFLYVLRGWDYSVVFVGALLGVISKVTFWKPQKSARWRRIVAVASSVAGAFICFLPAYLWLSKHSQYTSWIVILCSSTLGGILGGAAAAKLLKDTFRFKGA